MVITPISADRLQVARCRFASVAARHLPSTRRPRTLRLEREAHDRDAVQTERECRPHGDTGAPGPAGLAPAGDRLAHAGELRPEVGAAA